MATFALPGVASAVIAAALVRSEAAALAAFAVGVEAAFVSRSTVITLAHSLLAVEPLRAVSVSYGDSGCR